MERDKVWENITKKVAGEENSVDDALFDNWLNQDKLNKTVFDRLVQVWQHNPKQIQDTTSIYGKYIRRRNNFEQKRNSNSFIYYTLRVSAILFFLISTAFLLDYYINSNRNSEVVYQEISVPKGNRTSMILPDGSKVWLSNNSKIKYPTEFKGKTRELALTGEAYFEVSHNKEKPFIVNIGKNRIKVLGTKFSVSSYPEDNLVRADLISGKIQFDIYAGKDAFKSFLVKPMQGLVFDKTSRKLSESKIPDGFYDYWHKGIYQFQNETLKRLAVKIDRIYNTEIIFEDARLQNKRFSGIISIDDNIFTFIEAIKSTSIDPIEYRYEKNKLYIKIK